MYSRGQNLFHGEVERISEFLRQALVMLCFVSRTHINRQLAARDDRSPIHAGHIGTLLRVGRGRATKIAFIPAATF